MANLDPRTYGLLGAAAGLLGGAYNPGGRLAPALSQGLLGGLGAYSQAQNQALQQRELEQLERYRTAQMNDMLIEQKRKQAEFEEHQRLQGQVKQLFTPQPQGPQTGAITPNPFQQGSDLREDPVDVNGKFMDNPETWYRAATIYAGSNPQMAAAYRQVGDSIRKMQDEKAKRTKPEYMLDPVAGYPGVLYHKGQAKFYRDGVEVTGKELEALRLKVAEASRMQANVNVDARSFDTTGGSERAKAVQEQQTKAMKAEEYAGTVEMAADLLEGYSGGPLTQFQAKIGSFFPESEYGRIASIQDLAQAVVGKNMGNIRATGSGQTSDFEAKLFVGAVPSLAQTPQGRQFMKIVARRQAEREIVAADIYSDLAQKGPVKLSEWRKKVREQLGPLFTKEEEDFMRGRKPLKKRDGYKAEEVR